MLRSWFLKNKVSNPHKGYEAVNNALNIKHRNYANNILADQLNITSPFDSYVEVKAYNFDNSGEVNLQTGKIVGRHHNKNSIGNDVSAKIARAVQNWEINNIRFDPNLMKVNVNDNNLVIEFNNSEVANYDKDNMKYNSYVVAPLYANKGELIADFEKNKDFMYKVKKETEKNTRLVKNTVPES